MVIVLLVAILLSIVYHGQLQRIMNNLGRVVLLGLAALLCMSSCTRSQAQGVDLCSLPNVSTFIRSKLMIRSGTNGIPDNVTGIVGQPVTPEQRFNFDRSTTLSCQVTVSTSNNQQIQGYAILEREPGQYPEQSTIRWVSQEQEDRAEAGRAVQIARYNSVKHYTVTPRMDGSVTVEEQQPVAMPGSK